MPSVRTDRRVWTSRKVESRAFKRRRFLALPLEERMERVLELGRFIAALRGDAWHDPKDRRRILVIRRPGSSERSRYVWNEGELKATAEIMADKRLVSRIRAGLRDVRAGRVRPATKLLQRTASGLNAAPTPTTDPDRYRGVRMFERQDPDRHPGVRMKKLKGRKPPVRARKDVDEDCPMCRMLGGLPPKPLTEYKKPFEIATNLGSMGLGKPGEWDVVRHHGSAKGRKDLG